MEQGGGVHTVPAEAALPGWWNKVDGQILSRHRLKEEAVEAGIEIARKLRAEHSIHREDGEITETSSYGNDPNPPKDEN